ncbi:MAG: UTRA domain-containing protein [Nitriliruptorales bacterium]|nr:UTRA domain-containing protein [Nitriliruptorales bacterium]
MGMVRCSVREGNPASEISTARRSGRPARETYYQQAKQALEGLAVRLVNQGEARLPAEDQLSDDLGFSRPTVRSALLALQKEGKIQRLHGVGTFINRYTLGIDANVAEDRPFLDIIASMGHAASVDIVRFAEEELPGTMLERAGSPASPSAIVIDRLFRASGRPAVYSRDHVPTEHLNAPAEQLTAEHSTFAFVRRWSGHRVRYSVAAIRAITAPDFVAQALELAPSAPVLLLDHRHIDDRDRPIGVTESYINDDLLRFSVVRTGDEL